MSATIPSIKTLSTTAPRPSVRFVAPLCASWSCWLQLYNWKKAAVKTADIGKPSGNPKNQPPPEIMGLFLGLFCWHSKLFGLIYAHKALGYEGHGTSPTKLSENILLISSPSRKGLGTPISRGADDNLSPPTCLAYSWPEFRLSAKAARSPGRGPSRTHPRYICPLRFHPSWITALPGLWEPGQCFVILSHVFVKLSKEATGLIFHVKKSLRSSFPLWRSTTSWEGTHGLDIISRLPVHLHLDVSLHSTSTMFKGEFCVVARLFLPLLGLVDHACRRRRITAERLASPLESNCKSVIRTSRLAAKAYWCRSLLID